MKTLYLRIYLTVVAVLVLFALVAGWIAQRNVEQERAAFQSRAAERAAVLGELIENNLPPADATPDEQRAALVDWAARLGVPMALDDVHGRRVGTSEVFARRERERDRWRGDGDPPRPATRVPLSDGRVLWVDRPGLRRSAGAGSDRNPPRLLVGSQGVFAFAGGVDLALAFGVLFLAVAAGAYPVVRRLTRRLEALRSGVEAFGAGELSQRVQEDGRDEVAAVAASFNRAAQRIEELVRANKSLLANASHELRSPLARMKMAVAMLDSAGPDQREQLKREIETNIAELDALVEEVLLASRLDAVQQIDRSHEVDLLALSAEEGARVNAAVEGEPVSVNGDERLLRRALRNLLENARRYGGDEVTCTVSRRGAGPPVAEVRVADRGPGVPDGMRERIFEPFFRLPGHAERAGGVGLGLALVRQIAQRHGGSVRCEPRDGPGTCFVLSLPV